MAYKSIILRDPNKKDYFYKEAIKTLRTNVQFSGKNNKVILLTSSHGGEGKSDIRAAMAISKAQQKAVNKYVRENYDRVNVNMPKGKKEKIQEQAALCGMSVNAYINAAIDEKLNRDAEATE